MLSFAFDVGNVGCYR